MGTYRIENCPSASVTLAPELQKEFAAVRTWRVSLPPTGPRLRRHRTA